MRIVGRSAPDGRVGVDGLIRGGWVRLATGRSHRGRLVVETATRGATVVRLRAGAARSYAVAVP